MSAECGCLCAIPVTLDGIQAFLDQRGEDHDDCQSYSDLVS